MKHILAIGFLRALAVVAIAGAFADVVPAQTTNNQSILGTVQDESGAVIPGATVTAVNEQTNLTRSATSNQSGNYVLSQLPIGFYDISAIASGFKKAVLTKVEVTVGQHRTSWRLRYFLRKNRG